MVTFPGGVPPQASTLGLVASAKPDLVLNMRIIFDIRKKPEWQKWQEDFRDPKSPHYRKFLTTEEGRELRKPPASWFDQVGSWLTSQGFTITARFPDFMGLRFSGTVAQVDKAFRVEVMSTSDGKHYSILADPMMPARFQGIVIGILGLDNIGGVSPAAGLQVR